MIGSAGFDLDDCLDADGALKPWARGIVERLSDTGSVLTMRTQIKRLARLALSFSKKWENLWYAIALHFAYYDFCRIHSSLRVTPAMESNLADHIWTVQELLSK